MNTQNTTILLNNDRQYTDTHFTNCQILLCGRGSTFNNCSFTGCNFRAAGGVEINEEFEHCRFGDCQFVGLYIGNTDTLHSLYNPRRGCKHTNTAFVRCHIEVHGLQGGSIENVTALNAYCGGISYVNCIMEGTEHLSNSFCWAPTP